MDNPPPDFEPRFIGADEFASTGGGNIDQTPVISGISNGDVVVVAIGFDGGSDNTWSWDTGGGSVSVTTLFDGTAVSDPGYFFGWFTYNGNLRLKTTGVGSGNWTYKTLIVSAYRNVSTLVGSGSSATTPSATGTGTLSVLASVLEDQNTTISATPSGYTLAGQIGVGVSDASTSNAQAYKIGSQTNPSAKLTWAASGNERNAVLLFR